MTHAIWHIICGGVGQLLGWTDPVPWQTYSRASCGYKLSAAIPEIQKKRLLKKLDRRMSQLRAVLRSYFPDDEVHRDLMFAGEYCGFALGTMGELVDLPPFPIYSDGLFTYSFNIEGLEHAEASALIAEAEIIKNEAYLDIYDVTGGEIHPYTEHPDE
jgi:hypothetical protein